MENSTPIRITECPRDAMQGIKTFIPTEQKANYINALLKCGFDTIDFGSFVSPKAIPQMQDTAQLLESLTTETTSKLLAIVANERGAEQAISFDRIDYLGYPFSVSEEFQIRNTNSTIEESLHRVEAIQNATIRSAKELVVYLSMGFGNPYGEAWNPELVIKWSERLSKELGVKHLALSDTIGCATPEIVTQLFQDLIPALPQVEFAAHLHTLPQNATKLVAAAYGAGCRKFDGALKGFGGCPMAKDDLTGNMPTELMIAWLEEQAIETGINSDAFANALQIANQVFNQYA